MTKKINESDITSPGRPVRPAGHKDLFWYKPGYAIIKGAEDSNSSRLIGSRGGSGASSIVGPGGGGTLDPGVLPKPIADTPQLSDISIVSNTKYFDEIGKERAKIVLKIKNSSLNKQNIAGVDARIYQPKGA